MKTYIVAILIIVFLCAGAGAFFFMLRTDDTAHPAVTIDTAPEPVEAATMVLTEEGWEPKEVAVYKGGTVTFSTTRNQLFWPASNLHPSHDIYPEFDPLRPLEPNETWTFAFDRVGVWRLHDHVRSYYRGTIYVVEK